MEIIYDMDVLLALKEKRSWDRDNLKRMEEDWKREMEKERGELAKEREGCK